jgi:enoyl-CoA hydratase/carnithine racemase
MTYEYQTVAVEVLDGVATCSIHNGDINLFDIALYTDMARLAAQLQADNDVRVVVMQSANPSFFIAHFDVGLILQFPPRPAATELNDFQLMCERFRTMPKATIAVIEGRVGGGGSELALSFDMRFALIDGAVFNQPEVALGILPGGSGTVRLPRLVGRSRALEVVLGCDDIDARTAEQWGWVNRALPASELRLFVDRLARRIASFPPGAVAEAKASVLRAEADVPRHLLDEAAAFGRLYPTPSAQSAMSRFMEQGGQTVAGELRLGELAGELADRP